MKDYFEQLIASLYVAIFGRAPDKEGLDFWLNEATTSGLTDLELMNSIAEGFTQHPSFDQTYGGLGNVAFVDAIYQNIGGNEGDAAGKAYWVQQLQDGATRAEVVASFVFGVLTSDLTSPEFADLSPEELADAQARQDFLLNQVTVGLAYVDALGVGSNLNPSTDPFDLDSLLQDPAYLAAGAILNGITDDPASIQAALDFLAGAPTVDDILNEFSPPAPGDTFTLTPGVDLIAGTGGDDLIRGNSETFNEADQIDGAAGFDTLSLVLSERDVPYVGAQVSNVEELILRSIAVNNVHAPVTLSMTNFDESLQQVRIAQSTGDTLIEDLQAGVDLFIDDVRGYVEIDFDNQNAPEVFNVSVNEFGASAGGGTSLLEIDPIMTGTVNVSDDAAGPGFYNTFLLTGGFEALNVTGGAQGTELNMGVRSTNSTLVADFVGNGSDAKDLFIDMSGADQTLTLTTGDYSDDVEIDSQSSDNIDANLGEGNNFLDMGDAFSLALVSGDGNDSVFTDNIRSADINLGEGNNYLEMGNVGQGWWGGGLDLVTGDGNDYVSVGNVSSANIDLGEGTNQLYMGDVYSLNLTTGSGNDFVSVDDVDYASIDLGEGDNTLYMDDVFSLNLTTGGGNDFVSVDDVYSADINLGDGNNTLYMDDVYSATIVTGDGDDEVWIEGAYWWWGSNRELDISLGGGDDFLRLGGNGLEDGFGASDNHTIDGGEGNDTLRLNSLNEADAAGSFAFVTSIETLQLDGGMGGSLDGVTTGANDAGVVNYEFLNGNYWGEDITLTNVVNDVTVRMDLNEWWDAEGQNFTLTQIPDDDANVANVHFNMDDYWWWSNQYSFGDIRVDTTEVLNMSGTDNYYWWWGQTTLEIAGLYSEDLTTLNLSGDLEFDFWNIEAPNLSLVDASAMTASVDIELNDVADDITVFGGSGNDTIEMKDVNSNLTAFGGDGNDLIIGGVGNDALYGGAGNDTIIAGSGIDSVYGGDGDDLILWDANELSAVDLIDGGDGFDTVELENSLGVRNDDFFFQWSNVEKLVLDAGGNILTLGIIASVSGLEELVLSDDGGGTGDTILLVEGWNTDTAITLSDGDDTVIAFPPVDVDLRIFANAIQVTAGDVLTGGAGNDTLFLTADNGTADLTNVTNFETVLVERGVIGDESITIATTGDLTVAADATLVVDARALVLGDYDDDPVTPDTVGTLTFNGLAELDGNFEIWGGDGDDVIEAGAGNDVINVGEGNNFAYGSYGDDVIIAGDGDNFIIGGAGNDVITTGDGNNLVYGDGGLSLPGEGGDDIITTGAGNDTIYGGEGNDVISAGDGDNWIVGGEGADVMSGGSGIDTYVYESVLDTSFGAADTIIGFNAGGDGVDGVDLFDMTGLLMDTGLADGVYLGFFANFTLASNAVSAAVADDGANLYLVMTEEVDGTYLYGDLQADGSISTDDLAIQLVGMTGELDQSDFVFV